MLLLLFSGSLAIVPRDRQRAARLVVVEGYFMTPLLARVTVHSPARCSRPRCSA